MMNQGLEATGMYQRVAPKTEATTSSWSTSNAEDFTSLLSAGPDGDYYWEVKKTKAVNLATTLTADQWAIVLKFPGVNEYIAQAVQQ